MLMRQAVDWRSRLVTPSSPSVSDSSLRDVRQSADSLGADSVVTGSDNEAVYEEAGKDLVLYVCWR